MRLAWLGMTVEVGVRSDGRAGHGSTALATGAPPLQNRRERGRREGRPLHARLTREGERFVAWFRARLPTGTGAAHKRDWGAASRQGRDRCCAPTKSRRWRAYRPEPGRKRREARPHLEGTIPTRSGQVVSCPYAGFGWLSSYCPRPMQSTRRRLHTRLG